MKNKIAVTIEALVILGFITPTLVYSGEGIEGIWLGTLKVSGMESTIVFKMSRKPDGTLTATMDNLYQRMKDIPVDEVSFENDNLRLEVKSILFEGKIKEDGSTIEGEWKQARQSLPLVLKRIDKAPELRRPQEAKKPYPYEEEKVVYENKKAGIKLAGFNSTTRLSLLRESIPGRFAYLRFRCPGSE